MPSKEDLPDKDPMAARRLRGSLLQQHGGIALLRLTEPVGGQLEVKEFIVDFRRGRNKYVLFEGENLIRPKNKKMAEAIYLGSCNHGHTVMIPWVLRWSKFFFQAPYYFTPKAPFQDIHQRNRYLCRQRGIDRNSSTCRFPLLS